MRRACAAIVLLFLAQGLARANEVMATAFDAITTPGKPVDVRVKLVRSGIHRRNVAGEPVTFGVSGRRLSARTDHQGFAGAPVTPAALGIAEVEARLDCDQGAVARARLFALDPTRPVAVVDVDGTLSDMAEWLVPAKGDKADTFPGAPELLRDLARTHVVIYLTARDDRFDTLTRAFLSRHRFPDGPVIYNDIGFATADERAELNPRNHGKFKLGQIEALRSRGVRVTLGIGNAETDAFAYESAGLESCILTTKQAAGSSFRFTDYSQLRAKLEAEGILAPSAPVAASVADHRLRVARALTGGDDAIIALGADDLAVATPDEKVAMLEVLMSLGKTHAASVRTIDPTPVKTARQAAIVRILATALDAASFDRIYFRLNAGRLSCALSGSADRELRDLIARHRAEARAGDWAGYLAYLDQVTGSTSTGKNDIDFLVDGAKVIPVGLREIAAATKSIHLSVYQWEADETGTKLARILIDKAKVGVKVRVLLDQKGTGTKEKTRELERLMSENGIEVIVNPSSVTSSHLDHRKVLVIDGRVGFTGGMNVGDHYQKEWHDQQTLIVGPAVAKLQDAFLSRWKAEGGTPPLPSEDPFPALQETANGVETRIVSHEGGGVDRNIKAAYLRAIATSTRSIRIATPYFADLDVIDELCVAARRGVRVQVVLPRENDISIMRETARAFYGRMLEAGVEVYEYLDRMAHEKVAVIDGTWCTAGSSNLDARSLEFNDELNYVVIDPRLATAIERDLFEVDLPRCERIRKAPNPVGAWALRELARWL